MKYLLDASSLMLIVKNADIKSAAKWLPDSAILDLTFYEVGNVLWKETTLSKLLSEKEAKSLASAAETVFAGITSITTKAEAFQKILEIAKTEKLSYYDSSYIWCAKETGLTLVTEDKELGTRARKYTQVSTVKTLLPQ